MAVTKFLARDLSWEINTGTEGAPTWVPIKGLNNSSHAPSLNRADTSDFDSGGRDEHLPAARGDAWTLAGFSLEDVGTGDRDPGQLAVEVSGRLVGPLALAQYRMTTPGGNSKTFVGSVVVTTAGGDTNAAAAWSAEVSVSGAVTDA